MKKFTGEVVSKKNKNTAIIEVVRFLVHPMYEKRVKRTKRYPVHDLTGVSVGDTVQFIESRPYSKTKKWVIAQGMNSEKKPEDLGSDSNQSLKTKKEKKQ